MKITVKCGDNEIVIDEGELHTDDKCKLKYGDQKERAKDILLAMCGEMKELLKLQGKQGSIEAQIE